MTGEGGQFSEASCYITNIIVVLCFFGFVWRFRILWEGSFSLCAIHACVLVLLFIFKLHFLNTTIVSLMYSVKYTYQGSYRYSGRLALGSPLEFWELNRNELLGSIYFWSDILSHYVPIITEPFSA